MASPNVTRLIVSSTAGLFMLGASCPPSDPTPPADLTVINQTDQTVYVSWVDGLAKKDEAPGGPIRPGRSDVLYFIDGGGEGDCTEFDAIAVTGSSEIIDRLDSPTCFGETWAVRSD